MSLDPNGQFLGVRSADTAFAILISMGGTIAFTSGTNSLSLGAAPLATSVIVLNGDKVYTT